MMLVCGEALLDVFAAGDTATGMALEARVGGSPFNLAVGLARLGQPVAFFSAVSSGFMGERLMRALHDEGVNTSAVLRTDAPTTLSVVGLDAAGVPSYAFYGERGADRQLPLSALANVPGRPERPGELSATNPISAISEISAISAINVGSYATVVEPIASTLRALVRCAKCSRPPVSSRIRRSRATTAASAATGTPGSPSRVAVSPSPSTPAPVSDGSSA